MIIFIRLGVILIGTIFILALLTQVIIPSFRGTDTWPMFKKKRKAKQLEAIQDRMENVEAEIVVSEREEQLVDLKGELVKKKKKIASKKEKLN